MVCMIIYTINYGSGVFGPEMAMNFSSTFVEPMLGEWAAHGQPTARLGTVKNSPGWLGWTGNGPCVFQAKYRLNWMA